MTKERRVNRDYLKAFNLGYEIAKELNLSSPMFKGQILEDSHLNAVQAGMMEYNEEMKRSTGNQQELSAGQELGRNVSSSNGEEKGWGQSL